MIYVNRPKKTLKGKTAHSHDRTVRIESTQIRWFSGSQTGGWTVRAVAKITQN
jgi:hypothetical protein